MRVIALVLLLCYSRCCYGQKSNSQSAITGGEIAHIHDHPFMGQLKTVFVGHDGYCGLTILHAEMVLTAANCVARKFQTLRISIGSAYPHTWGVHYYTLNYTAHPLFTLDSLDYDIAVVRPDKMDLSGAHSSAVKLTDDFHFVQSGTQVTILGWGRYMKGTPAPLNPVLMEATIPVVKRLDCVKRFGDRARITRRMFCAGEMVEHHKSFCLGDAGGPAIDKEGEQVGIMTSTSDCGVSKDPGIFTSIGPFREWIREIAGV